jgi:hypothetical protein
MEYVTRMYVEIQRKFCMLFALSNRPPQKNVGVYLNSLKKRVDFTINRNGMHA